ncbi:MAG: GTPase, partial [Lacisediminimonas sp.]|nr:GTPase [Lacisediminimonas sp.]
DGINVELAGQPNVGKSSLLNALAGADIAIVTPIAGTTRDKVSQTIQIDGVPVNIIDTAGIRDPSEAADEVERIGMERTWQAVENADVVLHMLDATRGPTRGDEAIAERLPGGAPVIRLWNKIDLSGHRPQMEQLPDSTHIYLSATDGVGLDLLRAELLRIAGWQQTGESIYLARERHLIALRAAREHLNVAAELAARSDEALDLFAEELRLAQERLNSITGEFSSDDLLGVIFGRFCIGK